MSTLIQIFKKLKKADFPPNLHAKIMAKIRLYSFLKKFSFIIFAISLNFLISTWYVTIKIIDLNVFAIIRALFDSYEPSLDYFLDFSKTVIFYLPVSFYGIITINFALIIFIVIFTLRLKKNLYGSLGKDR